MALHIQRQKTPDFVTSGLPGRTVENTFADYDCMCLDQEPGGKGLLAPGLHLPVYKMGTIILTSTGLWN